MKALRVFGNYNPSGIVINEGWIALAACVYGDLSVEWALHVVCGMGYGGDNRKKRGTGRATEILQLHKEVPALTNQEIATRIGCSREMVRLVLKQHGLKARQRKKTGYVLHKERKAAR